MLKDTPILLLDEATSAQDQVIESQIVENLRELFKGRTKIVIAHRLSSIVHADRILVLNNGRVEEIGTHAQLINTPSSLYSKMWKSQSNQ